MDGFALVVEQMQVQVVDEHVTGAGAAVGRVGPDDGGAHRFAALAVIDEVLLLVLDQQVLLDREEQGFVGVDQLGGALDVQQPEAEGVVRPRVIAALFGCMDRQGFYRGGEGRFAAMSLLVFLDQQEDGAGHVGRGHAGAGHGAVARWHGGVGVHTHAADVGLDAAVQAGPPAGKAAHLHAFRAGVSRRAQRLHRTHGEDVLGRCVVEDVAVVHAATTLVAAGDHYRVVGSGVLDGVVPLGPLVVATVLVGEAVGVVGDKHALRCGVRHLRLVVLVVEDRQGGFKAHALGVGVQTRGNQGSRHMGRVVLDIG